MLVGGPQRGVWNLRAWRVKRHWHQIHGNGSESVRMWRRRLGRGKVKVLRIWNRKAWAGEQASQTGNAISRKGRRMTTTSQWPQHWPRTVAPTPSSSLSPMQPTTCHFSVFTSIHVPLSCSLSSTAQSPSHPSRGLGTIPSAGHCTCCLLLSGRPSPDVHMAHSPLPGFTQTLGMACLITWLPSSLFPAPSLLALMAWVTLWDIMKSSYHPIDCPNPLLPLQYKLQEGRDLDCSNYCIPSIQDGAWHALRA